MTQLPQIARAYVAAVMAIGAALFAVCLPQVTFQRPVLFVALFVLSSVTAALKVSLPLTSSGSTMSVSYAVDFAALLLLGPNETMLVAAGSAFSQCQFNAKEGNPLHRTLFSMASLVITVQGAGLVFHWLGGGAQVIPLGDLAKPLVGAATAYFLLNTGQIATAIALSTRRIDRTDLEQQFSLDRAKLLRRRRHRGAGVVAGRRVRPVGDSASRSLRFTSPTAPTRSTWAEWTTNNGTCSRRQTCTWRRSKRWRARSTPKIR